MEVCFSLLDIAFLAGEIKRPSLSLDTRPHLGTCERSILLDTHQRKQGFGVRFDGVKLLGWIRLDLVSRNHFMIISPNAHAFMGRPDLPPTDELTKTAIYQHFH